ncbi:hypothetical protein JJL56_32065 [Azospirillum sp. YIM DDC1]|uniref:Secreted protein n=1 Tax=Azospirillum aestuarii TaxID=2802052 RepID=A0ABS1I966_9PROT|nr:hypothetical protein [Azospirillum aestuarii]MBK4723484.1 hypothetical protein [Azospirillum aestuarii]
MLLRLVFGISAFSLPPSRFSAAPASWEPGYRRLGQTRQELFSPQRVFLKTACGSGAEGNSPPAFGRLGGEAITQEAFELDLLSALRHLIDRTNMAAPVRSDHTKKHGGGVSRILTVAHPNHFPCRRGAGTRRTDTTILILIDCDVFAMAFHASAERK